MRREWSLHHRRTAMLIVEILIIAMAMAVVGLFSLVVLVGAAFALASFLWIAFRAIFQPSYLSNLLDG